MKKIFFIISLFASLNFAQVIELNEYIPSAEEAFVLSAEIKKEKIFIKFKVFKDTYIYADKFFLGNIELVETNYELLGEIIEREDYLFGFVKVLESDFKIIFSPDLKKEISFKYQGCYRNKICYPSVEKKISIKYSDKKITSVKID